MKLCAFVLPSLLFGLTPSTESPVTLQMKFDSLSNVFSSWQGGDYFRSPVTLNGETIYLVTNNNENVGFFSIDHNDKITIAHEGEITNKNQILEWYTGSTYDDTILTKTTNAVSNIEHYLLPTVPDSLYVTSSDSFVSMQKIEGTPHYYNEPYGVVENGCAPTSAAMLLSFYDRYTSMTNLIDGVLPLDHSENKTLVDQYIVELAELMNTDSIRGTSLAELTLALDDVFDSKNYNFGGILSYSYSDYSKCINTYHNPALVTLMVSSEMTGGLMHTTLGIGTENVRYVGNMIVARSGDYESPSDTYITTDRFHSVIYVAR